MLEQTSQASKRFHMVPTTIVKNLNPIQKPLMTLGIIVALALLILIVTVTNWTQGILYIIGIALGATLLHARFGFTSAFRRLAAVGNGQGIQAHMIMLAVATTLFAIILGTGFSFTGGDPSGNVHPVGVSVILGSFIFGIGMQLGNGCGSGTLYILGGGRSSMILTLIAFIIGSTLGAYHMPFWNETPALPPFSLATSTGLGFFGAWIVQLALFAFIYWLVVRIAKRKKAPPMKPLATTTGIKKIFRGAWPLFAAAIILGVLNALVLTIKGEPWGVTSGFALWGAKTLQTFGVDVASWGYFSGSSGEALNQTVLAHATSVMNFGIILGAFISATAQGTFKPKKIKPGPAGAAIIGGLMMGYGARLAFGCNIGAYFGGIASFSLHGWVWGIMALLGTGAALLLRPVFGLKNPNKNDQFC